MGRKERDEKKEMKIRLVRAFDHAKAMKDAVGRVEQQRANERARWQEVIRGMKEKHLKEMRRLPSGGGGATSGAELDLAQFNEQMIGELTALQQHMQGVKEETIDLVVLEGDSIFASTSQQSSDPLANELWSQEQPGHVAGTDSD